MAATTVPAALALLAGSTGAPTSNNGNQTPFTKALLAALSAVPSAAQGPATTMGFLNAVTQPQNIAPSSNAGNASNLCEQCKTQPKHVQNGRVHPYCSKTCAAQLQPALCTVCSVKPRYNDGTKTHPFCGRSCATKAKQQQQQSNTKSRRPSTGGKQTSKPTGTPCSLPGCTKPAYKDQSGATGHYCSNAHKKIASEACLMCNKASKQKGHFCTHTCADDAAKQGPCILEVPEGHVTFKSVADQFKVSWRHTSKPCPTVRRVYKIIGAQASLDKYDAYRDAVESRGQFATQGRSPGNENRRWHGTRRECALGDKGNTTFCGSTNCSLCCIVKTSYDLNFFGKKTSWGRFGAGIYTSSTSSKSDDYSENRCTSNLKAILLNKVVVGKGCKMMQNNTGLTAPPAGYDSVLAEKGGVLNHDELVVYTNDAIRPSYLVMYEA